MIYYFNHLQSERTLNNAFEITCSFVYHYTILFSLFSILPNILSSTFAMTCWSYTCFALALLFFLCVDGKSEERKFRLIVEEFVPRIMAKDLFDDFSCEVTELRNRSYINCIMRLNRNIDQFELDTSLDMIRPNQQTLRIYKVHFNGCQLFTTMFKVRMFHLLAESINGSVKDRLKCPLKEVSKSFDYI